jgi:hypothetical protein
MNVDAELDHLYGSPLRDYTRLRNELAKALAQTGDRAAAAEVKALAKPSIPAWAVNQLARRERLQTRSLFTASDRVRKAQEKLLGGGSADELRDASTRQREVVDALVESASGILESAGHAASETTLERIRKTLTAVASDDEGRRLVETGRLTKELEPAGFGPFASGAPAKVKKGSRRSDATWERRVRRAEEGLQVAEAEAAQARERLDAARDDLRAAERMAEAARRAVAEEERKLERLSARTDAARAALEQARSS